MNVAQWLGIPFDDASQWLADTVDCPMVIDDIEGEDTAYWLAKPSAPQPPSDRVGPCRKRRWCKRCGDVISLLGNGWHVGATSTILAEVIRTAAFAKLGTGPHLAHPFQKFPMHKCPATGKCPCAVTLDEVRNKQKLARMPQPPPLLYV